MVTLLLKKSYQHKDHKEIKFNDLWNAYGVFTTMRVVGKNKKILFFKEHIDNLIKSLKNYGLNRKDLKKTILRLIRTNLPNIKNFDHLFRVAVNSKMISISLRKRNKSKLNFKLKLLDYKRIDPEHKNLKYKKILTFLKKLDNREYDVALHKNKKFLETGTSNLLFVQNKNIFSPKTSFYSGTTFKFFKKKIKITLKDIKLKDVKNYEEIILIGSGKAVTSVSKIEKLQWKRKSFEIFYKLKKIYNKQL